MDKKFRYSGINYNDVANGEGISLSVFLQGCPHRCEGCFNPETWDFNGGKEFTDEVLNNIVNKINANGIERNLSILGGEPLCPGNVELTALIIRAVKQAHPQTSVYIWTGYTYEDLMKIIDLDLAYVLDNTDVLIDGPFIQEQKDLTLPLRGSRNQRVLNLKIPT